MKTLTRKQKLVELIRTLDEAQTTWHPASNGGGPRLMPSQYHEGSYQELEHHLHHMRDNPTTRTLWWHLNHRYRWGTTHKETVPCRHTRQGPQPRLRPHTELVTTGNVHGNHIQIISYQWNPHVNDYLVDMALDHLLTTMPAHRPRLPLTVLYRALGIAPPTERPSRHTQDLTPQLTAR